MFDISIIGAGITGAFSAWLLAKAGYRVALYDVKDDLFAATSVNPGGINPLHGPGIPGDMQDFFLHCYQLHKAIVGELTETTGIDYRFRIIDRLFLKDRHDKASLFEAASLYREAKGFSCEILDESDLYKLENRLHPEKFIGLITSGNAVVDSFLYQQALLSAGKAIGVQYIKAEVEHLIITENRVDSFIVNGLKESCNTIVLAGGYRATSLISAYCKRFFIKPAKGQLLCVKINGKPLKFDITNELTGIYKIDDNNYWLGGTMEVPDGDSHVTEWAKAEIIRNIEFMMPGLKNYEVIDQKAAYRPLTEDGRPVVGKVANLDNVYLCGGGGSKGILTSSGLAEELTSLIVSNECKYPELTPQRFDQL